MPLMEISGSFNMLGYAILTFPTALGVAWIFVSAINGIARQPEAKNAIMSAVWVGFAVVEALALFGVALAFAL